MEGIKIAVKVEPSLFVKNNMNRIQLVHAFFCLGSRILWLKSRINRKFPFTNDFSLWKGIYYNSDN